MESLGTITGLTFEQLSLAPFLDEVPVGLAVLDGNGRVLLVNRAYKTLVGFGTEDVRGLPCLHALRCRFCMQGCRVLKGIREFEPVTRETDIINTDRQRIPVRLTVAPIHDAEGNPSGYLETVQDMRQITELSSQASRAYSLGGLVGNSPEMEKIFQMLPGIARTDSSVLITGETGTGKDVLAEVIHQNSDRANGPFVKVNCGALPETLLESELFGHTKGAFTGAVEDKPGRFRMAHGGTLFLTEIGDLPIPLQVKLLSFLDDKVIYPLGSTSGFHADVRVICATHRNLREMVREKRFREDLLFRLNVVRFHLPPLRERGEDIGLLVNHFLSTFNERFHKDIRGFSDRAKRRLALYRFPGNVRELRNIIEYAVNFCREHEIRLSHLPEYLADVEAETAIGAPAEAERESSGLPAGDTPATWEGLEKRMIMDALFRAGGRKGRAAEILGWGRSTLWRKMKTHGLSE